MRRKKDWAERERVRYRFWQCLLERARQKTGLHSGISAAKAGWISTGAGTSGLNYTYAIRQHDAQVELWIDRGKDSKEENETIFDTLKRNKRQIEDVFGERLEWQRLEGKKACRIRKIIETGGYRDDELHWSGIQDAMIDSMIRLERALSPHISNLKP